MRCRLHCENAAFGLGCTKWQVTQNPVLPHALRHDDGTFFAMSRIMGEAALLILVGAVASVFTEPDALFYMLYFEVSLAWMRGLHGFGVEAHVANMPLFADRGWLSACLSSLQAPIPMTVGVTCSLSRSTCGPVASGRFPSGGCSGVHCPACYLGDRQLHGDSHFVHTSGGTANT